MKSTPAKTTPPHDPGQEESIQVLAPPGLLGQIDEETYQGLLKAVDKQHAAPPNPEGPNKKRAVEPVGRWYGPQHVHGPFRALHVKRMLIGTYLEEGIYQLHVKGVKMAGDTKARRRSLAETADLLGYSYAHVVQVFRRMKKRAFEAEGAQEVTGGVREFLNHHLEKAIEESALRLKDNAAYGAVLIRAVEAFKELNGLDSSEDRNLNVEELAERVRGRSPLLLEVVRHSADAEKKTDQAAVDGEVE